MTRFTSAKDSIDKQTYDEFFAAMAYYDTKIDEGNQYLDSLDHHSQIYRPVMIADVQRKNPGMMALFYQLAQEADAIKEYLIDKSNVVKMAHLKRYTENYNRALSDRTAEKYSEAESDYVALRELIGEVNLRRERLIGFTKGLEQLHFQLTSHIKLRELGIEDAVF
jgi:hypothetical protein